MSNFSHNRLAAILNQSAIAIQIYSREGKCVAVNHAWELLFHSKIQDLEGYNVLEDPQVKQIGVYDFFMRAFAGEEIQVPETYYDPAVSGNVGRGRWLKATFSPVRNEKNEVIEVAILFTDVTELKTAQQEVERSRDQFRLIFDNVPAAILVQNLDFNVVYANPAAQRLAGYDSLEEWQNKPATRVHLEYFTEEGEPFDHNDFPSRRALRGENPAQTVLNWRNKLTGEMRTAFVMARPILDGNGKTIQVVSIYHDITEKLRIETQLREAMAAKDLFFSVASHEFRTPITALKLNTQLMNLSYPQVSADMLSKLDRQVNKLSKLVDEMLDISRLSRGKLAINRKETNLSQLTREVLFGMMEQLKLASIPLTLNVTDNVIGAWDPDRLEQVVENLVTNAIRYARNTPLFVKVSMNEEWAILEVCDGGPGIPESDHDKIFNRYEQLRSFGERNGMGLGLYIVKEIISLHGGKISVSNLNTGGARFIIELPRQPQG